MNMETLVGVIPPPSRPASSSKRAILAATLGNTLEWYDFAVYAYLTPVISQLFFPSRDPLTSILSTFAVLAVGFIMRPVGAVFFGWLADRTGRKKALIVSVTVMGVATIALGLIPTHAQVGTLAAVLLTVARLFQGFSVGGEYGTSTSFLVEYAPTGRRGLFGSLAYFSSILGMAIGGSIVLVFSVILSSADMAAWGWRIPFLLSFPLLLLGTYMRLKINETPEFNALQEKDAVEKFPLKTIVRSHGKNMLIVMGIVIAFAISTYTVVSFMLSYLRTVIHIETVPATLSVVVVTVFGALLIPVFGWLSDRVGRKPLLILACVSSIVLPLAGLMIVLTGSMLAVYVGQMVMWVPVAIFCGVTPAAFAELFPTEVRVSGFGIAYAVSTALFSGTAPFIATLLVERTGNNLAPGWYIAAAGAISLLFVLRLRETNREELSANVKTHVA
ncbi:MFS transporter [Cryobacterium sp. Hh7]|uniref:MFS transporter n=1 Tax=Cryobacterium sp. Hh7 TaxID=1259159 RepID=UPI0018E0B5C9|nr:MFS transporter [Cryobacterium sp. Hh7]